MTEHAGGVRTTATAECQDGDCSASRDKARAAGCFNRTDCGFQCGIAKAVRYAASGHRRAQVDLNMFRKNGRRPTDNFANMALSINVQYIVIVCFLEGTGR